MGPKPARGLPACRSSPHVVDDVPALVLGECRREPWHGPARDAVTDPPEEIAGGVLSRVRRAEVRGRAGQARRGGTVAASAAPMTGGAALGVDVGAGGNRRDGVGHGRPMVGGRVRVDRPQRRGSASPAPVPSRASATITRGSRQARIAIPAIKASKPITPIWLPINARAAWSARPSSAANESRIVKGQSGARERPAA